MNKPYIQIFPSVIYEKPSSPSQGLFAVFGFEIPYLPEPLATESFVNQLEADYEHRLNQQIRFIRSLYPNLASSPEKRGYAVELRFVARSTNENSFFRSINLFVLGRVALSISDTPKSRSFIEQKALSLYESIYQSFPLEYALKPIDEKNWEYAHPPVIQNFHSQKQTAEIRKYIRGDTPYPFGWSDNSFANICKVLVQSKGTIVLSVCIQPSTLDSSEEDFLRKSSVATAPVDVEIKSEAFGINQQYVRDLQRKKRVSKARAAEYYYQTLQHPFLIRIQLTSDKDIPSSIVQTVGENISSPDYRTDNPELPPISHGYQYCYPAQDELEIAHYNFIHLEHRVWGDENTQHNKPLWRLRYLVNATEANCAFRIPLVTPYGLPGIVTIPFNPFASQQRISDERKTLESEKIAVGEDVNGVDFSIDTVSLSRHTLVVGSTGSGKTTTNQKILAQLWKQGCPFLVIEPVKSEYRRLYNENIFDKTGNRSILFFTLGDIVSHFEFNPFEVPEGISIGVYISALKSCFTAAFPLEGPMPIILERAIREAYSQKGWKDVEHRVTGRENRHFPTLSDLCQILEDERDNEGKITKAGLVRRLGYSNEIQQNLEAALTLRLTNLRDGLLGQTLNVEHTTPWRWEELLRLPVIMEFDSVVDDDEKALLIALIFTLISFYRKVEHQRRLTEQLSPKLVHITLIEEAHRLFANTGQSNNMGLVSTRAKAINVFTDMLAEMRSLGEGIIIAEQIPTKLVPDIIKHPDLKIMHRITADEDRRVLGEAMNFTESHRRYVATLKQGMAAVYMEGLYAPVLVNVEALESSKERYSVPELELFKYMVVRRLVKLISQQASERLLRNYLDKVAKRLRAFIQTPTLPGIIPTEIRLLIGDLLKQALMECHDTIDKYNQTLASLSTV